MNNEPVAWAYIKDGEFFDAVHPDEHDKYEGMYTTPVYAHPHPDNLWLAESIIKQQELEIKRLKAEIVSIEKNVDYWVDKSAKTLTDEEIEEFAYAFELWQLHNPDKALEGIMDFARAILKKASEK